MTKKIFDFIKLLYKDATRLHIGMFAGNASFFFFLCAIPLFTLIFLTMFSILKLDPVMIGKQMDVFLGFLPDKITPFVLDNFEWLQNYISEKIKFSWTLVLFFVFLHMDYLIIFGRVSISFLIFQNQSAKKFIAVLGY